jgi:DNA polymerase-3 subunit delta
VRSLLLGREIREEDLPAAFLFHGEDAGLSRELLRELRIALRGGDGEEPFYERFAAGETPWSEILDIARTMPFFFSPWRILAVEIEDADEQDMRAADARQLAEYLAAPTSRTLLVVIVDGSVRKGSALGKAFVAAKGKAQILELEAPDAKSLMGWGGKYVAGLGKRIDDEVLARLVAASERDFQRLAHEIDKVMTYIGDRPKIEAADVDALVPRVMDYENWALSDALEKGDIAEALRIVDAEFADGAAPQLIVGQLGGFLRRQLLAKSLLREGRDRNEVFREFKPKVKESWGGKYREIFSTFFATIDAFSDRRLDRLIEELQAVDLKIKSSDVNPRALIEAFLAEYGRMRKRGGATSSGRG